MKHRKEENDMTSAGCDFGNGGSKGIPFAPPSTASFIGWTTTTSTKTTTDKHNDANDDNDHDDEHKNRLLIQQQSSSSSPRTARTTTTIKRRIPPQKEAAKDINTASRTSTKTTKKKKRKRSASSSSGRGKRSTTPPPPPPPSNSFLPSNNNNLNYYTNNNSTATNDINATTKHPKQQQQEEIEISKNITLLLPSSSSSSQKYKLKNNSKVILQGNGYIELLTEYKYCSIEILGYELVKKKKVYVDSPTWMSALTLSCSTAAFESTNDDRKKNNGGETTTKEETEEEEGYCCIIELTPSSFGKEETLSIYDSNYKNQEVNFSVVSIPQRWKKAINDILQHWSLSSSSPDDDNDEKKELVIKRNNADKDEIGAGTVVAKITAGSNNGSAQEDDNDNEEEAEEEEKINVDNVVDAYGNPIANRTINPPPPPTPPHHNRVLICGAKNVGKSTYLRYAINTILSSPSFNKVAVLDCDTGQPEFGPPGLLSLTIAKEPILSPPHAHMSSSFFSSEEEEEEELPYELVASYYYGDITSKTNPVFYLRCISKLIQFYQNHLQQSQSQQQQVIPLLINTNGWIKSLGYEILSSVIDVVNPKHVVQILGLTRAKFFDLGDCLLREGEEERRRRVVHIVEAVSCMGGGGGGNSGVSTPMNQMSRNGSVASLTSLPSTSPTTAAAVENEAENTTTTTASALPSIPGTAATTTTTAMPTNAIPPNVSSLGLRTLRLCSYFLHNAAAFSPTPTKNDDATKQYIPSDAGLKSILLLRNNNNNKYNQNTSCIFQPENGIIDSNHTIASFLASMKPYVVPFEYITNIVMNSGDGCTCNDLGANNGDGGGGGGEIENVILDALNGAIVGLCYKDDDDYDDKESDGGIHGMDEDGSSASSGSDDYNDDDDDDDSHSTNTLSQSSSSSSTATPKCLGLGIIRSINRIAKTFYILTPIPYPLLSKITILVKGSIQLPMECMFRGVHAESFCFVNCMGVSSGGLPMNDDGGDAENGGGGGDLSLTSSPIGGDLMKSKNNLIRRGGG